MYADVITQALMASDEDRDFAEDQMRDILTALTAAGWGIGPLEPTPEMSAAGGKAGDFADLCAHEPMLDYERKMDEGRAATVYRAMVALWPASARQEG